MHSHAIKMVRDGGIRCELLKTLALPSLVFKTFIFLDQMLQDQATSSLTATSSLPSNSERSSSLAFQLEDVGAFSWEVVQVEVSGGRGRPSTIVDKDEGRGKFDAAKLRKLRPSFKESGGSVTAGNASSISDGAASLVLVSGAKVLELRLQVLAKISGFADAAQAPEGEIGL